MCVMRACFCVCVCVPGLTVHEAGDDNTQETMRGFPWTLRLRYIMEHATNLDGVKSLWKPGARGRATNTLTDYTELHQACP
jgi:hypothetical protein